MRQANIQGWTGALGHVLLAAILAASLVLPAHAGPREQARVIHDRLAGVPPSDLVLTQMENVIATNGSDPLCPPGVSGATCAAHIAMNNVNFYNVTLKNFAAPWTNREQSVFVPLNEYIATVIGMIRDNVPFNTLLSANLTYHGRPGVVSAAPSPDNNLHYEQLEENNINLRDELVSAPQSTVQAIPDFATAGVMTSRAASKAFFIAGTNRAMFRFTMLNHMCYDMEQVHDPRIPPDRIRQDVSRSPGGDSRLFLNNCIGCHNGMDPLAGAYAYYNYNEVNESQGRLVYTDGEVHSKYFNNDQNFPQGYRTTDDSWENRWRVGQNSHLGFGPEPFASGNGAKSLGEELGNSDAFAACQVRKVFRAVCLRDPDLGDAADTSDLAAFTSIKSSFTSGAPVYSMKRAFAETAVYCMGQ